MQGRIFLFKLFSIALVLSFFVPIASAEIVFQMGADKYNYLPTENITITGKVWDGTSYVSNATINISITNSTSFSDILVNTSSDGSFTLYYNVSDMAQARHNLTVEYGGTSSGNISFTVTNVAGAVGIIASDVYINNFTGYSLNPGWNTTPSLYINQSSLSGSAFPYYVLLENASINTGASKCERMFVSASNNFSLSNTNLKAKYLKEGTFFKINNVDYFVAYIAPDCSRANFIKPSNFTFSGGESIKIVATTIDSNRQRVPFEALEGGTALFEVYAPNGTKINSTMVGSEIWGYQIPSASGRYFMFLEGYPIGSFSVEKFTLKSDILNDANPPSSVYVIKPAANIKVAVDLINLSTGKAISSGATVTSEYENSSEASGKTVIALSYDSVSGRWVTAPHAGPSSGTRTYKITATVAGESQYASANVVAKSFEISTIPLSKGKGEGEGFAPNASAVMVVTARSMADGTLLNLTDYTNNCANTSITMGVTDSSGNDVLSAFNFPPDASATGRRQYNYNLTYFFSNLIPGVPSGVIDEFNRNFGGRSCVIVFNAPNQEGSFNTRVNANISGTIETSYNSFLIQTVFARGEPASDYRSGIWYFTPGSKVTMLIKATTADGADLPAANITDASLVEVVTEDGSTVTDSMLNETFANVTIGNQNYSAITFVVNDSVMGFHRVAFRIKARVGSSLKEAEGSGWFVEKKYHVFAYPRTNGGQWFLGANDNVTLSVQVMDESSIQSFGSASSGGNSSSSANENIQSISITVDEIRSADGWTKVTNWQAGSGTTNGQGMAEINITQTSPWSGGSYIIKVKATKSGTTDYGQGWFEVRNFNFWAYTQDWKVGVNQSINISLNAQGSDWQPINATVRLTDIIYHGSSGSWVNVPVSYSAGAWASANTSNGQGALQIPDGIILKSGFYEATLNATYGSLSQTSRAFFQAINFIIVTQKDKLEWDSFYQPGDIVNITVKAGKRRTWNWPPSVEQPVNISSAWIDDFRQEGMFDPMMKKGDATDVGGSLNLRTYTNCNGQNYTCQVWFNTSALGSGRYFFKVIANDTSGSQAEEFEYAQIKTFEIKSPETKFMQIPTTSDYKFTNTSAIKTDKDWKSCSDTQLVKPTAVPNVTNCKAMDIYNMTDGPAGTTLSVLIDLGNNKLYLDRNATHDYDFNLSNPGNTINIVNLTNVTTIDGIKYMVISIGDTVVLQSTNAVMRDSGGNGKADWVSTGWNPGDVALAVYFVSDSSKEYYAAFKSQNNWNGMRDDSWLQTDLDGDSDYNEAWHLVLKTSNNVVQNVYVSASTNLTNSSANNVHTYPGLEPANFTATGTPIYFVGAGYAERTGSSGYEVRFTSNRTGWSGMDLGTFGNNVNISVPVMITNGAGRVAGATVSITKVVPLGMGPPVEQPPTVVASAITDANGIAVVRFNTSWLGAINGRYALKFSATKSGKTGDSTGMPWEWPAIERRDFKLRISPGTFGNIPIKELSSSAGNLVNYTLYEASGQKFGNLRPTCGDNNYLIVDDYRYNRLVMNLTNDTARVFVRNEADNECDWNAIFTRPSYTAGSTIKIKRDGWTEFINLSSILLPGVDNITLNWPAQKTFTGWGMFVNITNYTLSDGIKLKCKILEWNWEVDDTSGWHPEGDVVCIGRLKVHLNATGGINLSINQPALALNNPWGLSLGGEWKIMKVANITDSGYELVYYDDAAVINSDNWAGRNPNGNPPRPDGFTFADRVLLINATTGAPATTNSPGGKYYLGDIIPELGKSVFGGFIWESKVFLTNETNAPYPLPWICDGYNDKFYFGNFSETDVNVDLNAQGFNSFNPPAPNATDYYSILLYDNECDGVGKISGGMYDDDRELMQRSACPNGGDQMAYPGCQDVPIDFYGTSGKSGGAPNETVTTSASQQYGGFGPQQVAGESWFKLGEQSWPITFVNETVDSPGNMSVLRETENFNNSQDIAYYIKARKLDGSFVNGNASIASVFDFMNFAPINTPTDTAPIINGVGVLRLSNFTNQKGSFAISLKVCDSTSNLCETMERPVFIGSMQDVYKMGEGVSGSSGGGGVVPK